MAASPARRAGPPGPASAMLTRVSDSSESRATSGARPSCSRRRSASQPSANERANQPSWRCAGATRAHAQRDARDHAERPLGADHQLAQRRARRAGGRAERRQLPGRRRAAQRDDVLVDAAVAGRGLAGRARGDAAADRRPLVALRARARASARARRAPARPPAAAGRGRAPRSASARRRPRPRPSAPGRARRRRRSPRAGLQAADDAGAAAERHDRHARLGAGAQHRGDLVVAAGRTTASGASSQSPARWASRSR